MEINYDLIIKYLAKKDSQNPKNKVNSFITQKNIYNYSTNFPDKFKSIFTDKFYRYGITVYDNNKNNISFWSSLLTIIDKNFIMPYDTDELNMINQFKNQLIEKYPETLDRNDLRERLKLEPDHTILQYIVDTLDINFIFFDFMSEEIYCMYSKDIMNPWKQTFIFAKCDNVWEPIMSVKIKEGIQRTFDFNDEIIKKILQEDIKYYDNDKTNKHFAYINNIDNIISLEKDKLKISDNNPEQVFIKSDNTDNTEIYNKTKLNKMKLSELNQVVTSLGLNLVNANKKATKSMLIDLILEKVNKK